MRKAKEKGQALITVLVFIAVFVAITFVVVMVATVSYKKATYSHNKLIAQELAETGIQDALYKLNYRYHDASHYYGFVLGTETDINPGKDQPGSCPISNINTSLPTSNSYSIPATLLHIPEAESTDGDTVTLKINGGTSYDTLISVGTYKGTQVTIQTTIRTISPPGNLKLPLFDSTNKDTKGIPEVFNKHVIYANTVSGTGTNITVNGNTMASTVTDTSTLLQSGEATLTETGISAPMLSSTPSPLPSGLGTSFYEFRNDTYYYYNGTLNPIASLPSLPSQVDGVSYDTPSDTYTFNNFYPPSGSLPVYIAKSTKTTPYGNAVIADTKSDTTIDTATNVIDFQADGDITINNNVYFSGSEVFSDNGSSGLSIGPNTTFNGDLIVESNSPLNISNSGITIDGALVCNNSITIASGATSLTIKPSVNSSSQLAAILINDSAGLATLDIEANPTITLGQNQDSVFMDSGVNGATVTIGSSTNVDSTNSITNLTNQATVVAYSASGTSNVNIGSTNYYAKVNGLIYSYGKVASGGITLENARSKVNGCLVTNGTVKLNGGTLTWDPAPYKMGNNFVYKGFEGRQRIFVPENWKITW